MPVKIITDTSCDLPEELLQENEIELIPLKVTFANGETYLDRIEISPQCFVSKMINSNELPKTAAPDPATFVQYFEKGLREKGEVIFISLSSGLSSTYNTAMLACNMLGNDKIKIFDTLTASLGTGIMAIKAAQLAASGLTVDIILSRMSEIRKRREVLFILDTLDNVVKGGRLSKVEGMAGAFLNVKPLLRANQMGVPEVIAKVRGKKKAVQRLLNMVGELGGDTICNKIIGISHVACYEEAVELADKIRTKYSPKQILVADMGATIGTYAGTGCLMINF